jgi:hypothetical protein
MKTKPFTTLLKEVRMRWYWWGLLVLLLSLASYALAVRIVNSIDYLNNDFFTFWLAGHMVMHGGDPYSPVQWVAGHHSFGVTWIPNQVYVYPLPLSLLFAPLGLFSLHEAFIVWVALSIMMILVALALLLKTLTGPGRFVLPLVAGIIFYRPTILTLFTGQVSSLLLLLVTITVTLWEKGKWEWGSLLLPILMLKPNLGAPMVVLLGLWLLFQKRYKAILAMLVMGLILLGIGFVQNPHWISAYWGIGNNKLAETFGGSPTVWGLGALISHNQITFTLVFGSLACLLVLFGFLRVLLHSRDTLRPVSVLALTICVTLLLTPYTWTYDQLLLIFPLTAAILAMDRVGVPFMLTAGVFLGIDLLAVILLVFDTFLQVEILNVLVPLAVFGLCLLYLPRRISSDNLEDLPKSQKTTTDERG